nr:uncharacterized protein LOC109169324 [Ipomoea batatas]
MTLGSPLEISRKKEGFSWRFPRNGIGRHCFLLNGEMLVGSVSVKEFYANAGDGINTDTAIVRGVEVDRFLFRCNQQILWYGKITMKIDYYHKDLKTSNLTVELMNEIAKTFDAEAEWNIRHGLTAHNEPQEGHTIDVGVLINQSIKKIITMIDKKTEMQPAHPSLITELLQVCGVKASSILLPRTTLQHIIPHAQRPRDADQQEEDVAMGDPDPMLAQPQFPQQFDMQQFFARQEEFMRRQDNFMRRNDEINWYVGTSAYQHNQAAQGFTPHFPPPPPWLQDPQYIPNYYRPHFPPPLDNADHH